LEEKETLAFVTNEKTELMKSTNHLLIVLIAILAPFSGSSQIIDTVEIDGNSYFVYPFTQTVSTSHGYWESGAKSKSKKSLDDGFDYDAYLASVKGTIVDSMIATPKEFQNLKKALKVNSYKKFMKLYSPKFGDVPSKEEFKRYIEYKKRPRGSRRNRDRGDYYDDFKFMEKGKFKKAVRKNPYPLLTQKYRPDKDITPVLDRIPDGEYVQYYDPYCLMDKKGNCDWTDSIIAGRFTIINNVLHGEATWMGLTGDTLKHGWFVNGVKEGRWTITKHNNVPITEEQAELYITRGYPDMDTIHQVFEFKNGAKNGAYSFTRISGIPLVEGHFTDNEESGEWLFRIGKGDENFGSPEEAKKQDLSKVGRHYTMNDDDSLIVKPIIIREGLLRSWKYESDELNFLTEYSLADLPRGMYEASFERQLDLDLEEEKNDMRDFEDEFYYEDEYYAEEYGSNSYPNEQATVYDPTDKLHKKRGVVFDSIGAYPGFIGDYERFYPNGQLMYKFEFQEGTLKEEPIIYWDNGVVHDEVIFVADSNHYLRNVYDYDGTIFEAIVYDELGDFVKHVEKVVEEKFITIDGMEVVDSQYGSNWYYHIADSLYEDPMSEKVLHNRSWSKLDTSKVWEGFYDPTDRTRTIMTYALDGSVMYNLSAQFSENFESWNGIATETLGDLQLEIIKSASFRDEAEVDSIPQYHVVRMFRSFDVTNDYTLKRKGEFYTGPLKIDFTKKNLAIKNDIVVEMNGYNVDGEKMVQEFLNYKYNGKRKSSLELEFSRLNATTLVSGSAENSFSQFFSPLLDGFFNFERPRNYESEYGYEEYEGEKQKKTKKKDKDAQIEILEGSMLDGKPIGVWTSYDQFGNIMVEVPFDKGEANGQVKFYDYSKPLSEDEYYYEEIQDTFPEKKMYYLSKTADYVNGNLDGKEIGYDWLGNIISETEYKEGYMDGISMERNKVATSISQYQNGSLDGYVRTYLTLPGQDSLLLYDLLFQNGALQGESKSYHTNGQISKRGFFLTGQPIDDYEGFDTLGFRYHYVKFEFSYPVEEKIWEENELSVRYMFDWKDSIPFSPIDITESESINVLLMDYGFNDGYMNEPYYGRPSLIEKGGIDYRLTKYYPNDSIARDGTISKGRKSGNWEYFSYEGEKLHQVNYFDSIISLNDSIQYSSKGIYTEINPAGDTLYQSHIIEKFERYDCSHSDHYETRQLKTIWESNDSLGRMNGDVINFYDNGTIQSAGKMKDGMPSGEWRFYDPNGKLNKFGNYVLGKRNGRWLSGDLSKTKYLGEICLNPNMPDIEEEIKYRENMLDIEIIYYRLGKSFHTEMYDIDMNFHEDWQDKDEEMTEKDGEGSDAESDDDSTEDQDNEK
jgi:antitoxin component YwqK of YwqJK toxin-antitoxin module